METDSLHGLTKGAVISPYHASCVSDVLHLPAIVTDVISIYVPREVNSFAHIFVTSINFKNV